MKSVCFSFLLLFYFSKIALCQNSSIQLKLLSKELITQGKVEFGIQLSDRLKSGIQLFLDGDKSNGINPFNPDHLSIQATFSSDTLQIQREGFYYEAYQANYTANRWEKLNDIFPFRVRFAAPVEGNWLMSLRIYHQHQLIDTLSASFTVQPSNRKGRLVVKENERQLYYQNTDEPFFGLANNISSGGFLSYLPSQFQRQLNGVKQLASAGGNLTRFELGGQAALPDWDKIDNYQTKMDEMQGFDELLSYCNDHEMYYIIFRHHVEARSNPIDQDIPSWDKTSWYENPYRNQLRLTQRRSYFTDETAVKWQLNTLRYILARWGWSPKFLAYGYSEIDHWYENLKREEAITDQAAIEIILPWLARQKSFMESLNSPILTCHSYGNLPQYEWTKKGVLSLSDFIPLHVYDEAKAANQHRLDRSEKYRKRFEKPVLLEEIGINDNKIKLYCATSSAYRNALWSTSFMGLMATGMDWWWDRGVFDNHYEQEMIKIKLCLDTFRLLNLTNRNFIPGYDQDKKQVAKRKLEVYYLQSETGMIAWAHHASAYWRNEKNKEIASLLASSYLTSPCVVGENHDVNQEGKGDYSNKRFEDAYTFQETIPALEDFSLKFKMKERGNYQITYYNSVDRLQILRRESRKTNRFGKLQIKLPKLDEKQTDVLLMIQKLD